MRKTSFGGILLIAAMLTVATLAFAQEQGDQFHWTGRLAPGQVVEIKGVNGSIDAQGVAGDQIEVTAAKSGDDRDSVHIVVVPNPEGVTICAVYPSRDGDQNKCEPGDSWHVNNRHNDTRVDFTVRLPKDLRFTAKSVNGDVAARDLGKFVKASSVNGAVRVATDDLAQASSVNGSVEVRMGRADWDGTLRFATVNGSIKLEVPSSLSADVHFHSVNGRLKTDFPMTMEGEIGRGRVDGRIGNGGRNLELNTVNGSVEVRKAAM